MTWRTLKYPSPMWPILFTAALTVLIGCATTPEQRAAEEQRRTVQREADQRRREADEQRRTVEREQNERRHEIEQRRNAEEDLRRKFARYSTGELKLMDTRYKELKQSSGRDLNVRVNAHETNSDARNIERLLEIERELLRRWKAGDAEAYLPEFEANTPGGKK